MIIMLTVMPMMLTTRNAIMNEIGIEVPIISAGRMPSVATQVIITSATAVSTAASSERNRLLVGFRLVEQEAVLPGPAANPW